MPAESKEVKLSRIYQGRVLKCEIEKNQVELSLLMQHHELFQDAVNYYMLALAAMASESDSPVGKFKERMKSSIDNGGAWENFWRNGEKRSGMKYSIMRTLDIKNGDLSFDQAAGIVLDKNPASPEILQAAVDLIAKKCKGDVQHPGRTYSPMLSDVDSKANFDFDALALAGKDGNVILSKALYSNEPLREVVRILPDLSLTWTGIKIQSGKSFKGDEARCKLKEAVEFFVSNPQKKSVQEYFETCSFSVKDKLSKYLTTLEKFENIEFERNNKTAPDNKNATLLLKFFPDEFTIGLMKCFVKEVKKVVSSVNPYGLSDDPIKLARGKRGYVFPYFTQRRMGKVWKKFDMEAFTEALKTLNQFGTKSTEREEKRAILKKQKDYMDGLVKSSQGVAGNDDEESISLVVLANDPRRKLLNELLDELGVSNSFTEDERMEYGLSSRTLRNFHELLPRWMKILTDSKKADIESELVKELHSFQTKNKDRMGSADLYHKLAEKRYWDIWREDYPIAKNQSHNILDDSVRYSEICDEIERLAEPINFTPADPLLSRRLNNLKVFGSKSNYGHGNSMVFTTQIAVKDSDGRFNPKDCILTYSAPRLMRDGLKDANSPHYLSPVLKALLPELENPVDFSGCAVMLMPDVDSNGKLRYLLNFPISLPVGNIQDALKTSFTKQQFYYSNSVYQTLLWPGIKNGKNVSDWYESGKSFSFVSVDLGQRTAGALCRIRVSADSKKNTHSVFLGNDSKRDWYAERSYAELLRLHGEDAKVWSNGKHKSEPYGDKGRPATEEEKSEACHLCTQLTGSDELLSKNDNLSFPEQNDKLLVAFRRAQGRWSRICRWLWMLDSTDKKDKAVAEYLASMPDGAPDVSQIRLHLEKQEEHLRKFLPEAMLILANRILPLRGRNWQWVECVGENSVVTHQLRQMPRGSDPMKKKICGQRGISFARISQLEEFRKRIQSLNRSLMRKVGAPPQRASEMREQRISDPCPDILKRLDSIKSDRINQTANRIIVQALGLRLKEHTSPSSEREVSGIHGEYERVSGIETASFIVMEDLSRYRISQDRSPFENTSLMKWCHRQVRQKIGLLSEIFGICVLDVPAAYSSKFSPEGIPGFRAEECTSSAFTRWSWIKRLSEDIRVRRLHELSQELEKFNATTLLPKDGGPIFVPHCGINTLIQADINAAFNIGIRSVAAPWNLIVNNRFYAVKEKAHFAVDRKSVLKQQVFSVEDKLSCSDETQKSTYVFVLPIPRKVVDDEKGVELRFESKEKENLILMTGKDLWTAVKINQLDRCIKLNEGRLAVLRDKKS